ncbi:MAG: NUDIX hydrolase [Parcubacteria group bacterium GW2011_GWF2_38_8]|nr:MAG: NUDIX hydrolase [Parcubacteria group bacterium GW2011_GWF2_38_8]
MSHIHEKIDWTVKVFIVYKNKILLRMHEKYKRWLSVGGHIELDEDPIQAALREVKEEVGLDVRITGEKKGVGDGTVKNAGYVDLIPPRYLGKHPVNDTHEHITLVYFAVSDTDKVFDSIDEKEKTESRWVSKEELEKMNLVPNILFYATEALKELGEK